MIIQLKKEQERWWKKCACVYNSQATSPLPPAADLWPMLSIL